MAVVEIYGSREEALDAARRLIEFRMDARVVDEGDGRYAVRLDSGSRSLALDILERGRPRFGRTVPWARSRSAPSLTTGQFAGAAAGVVAVFLLWLGLTDALGASVVIVVTMAAAVVFGGLWFVTPEAFEVEAVRPTAAEVVAVGILLALGWRVLFALIPLPAVPYRGYSLILWVVAASIPTSLFGIVVGRLLRARDSSRIRRSMTLFGGAGLAFGVVAGATYILDVGFTAGRWGLVPVWAVFGIYPILAVPFQVFGAGILGWGWASGARRFAISVILISCATGLFHFAVVRSPFWGPLLVLALGVVWTVLFTTNPENDPMVPRVPSRLFPPEV